MSLAYFILAFKNPRQVARLFSALYHPDDFIVLHFDSRSGADMHELARRLESKFPNNVAVLRPRPVLWGGFEMAAVQIEAAAVALRRSSKWQYYIPLSGQDFPIKRRDETLRRLSANPTANWVTHFEPLKETHWINARERVSRYYFESALLNRILHLRGIGRRLRRLLGCENRLPHVPFYHRKWPEGYTYHGGSNHVILTRAACEYLAHAEEPRKIIRWLSHSAHANEIVFQTALLNGSLASTVVSANLREVEFAQHASNPKIFRLSDFDRLAASDNHFARKFDDTVDAAILDRLEEHLGLARSAPLV